MPRAGQVRLRISRKAALEAARWLECSFGETPQWALRLASKFRKSAKRKGNAIFTTLVDKDDARAFAACRDAAVITRSAPPSTIEMMKDCKGRRGRRMLTQVERDAREQGLEPSTIDERHRKRVAREARYERAVRDWLDQHGTIIGSAGDPSAENSFPTK